MKNFKNVIYADNAATTAISQESLDAMMPYLTKYYANASSIYSIGRKCRDKIEECRSIVGNYINAEPDEIFFTSGGSESNNWAIKMGMQITRNIRNKFMTSSIEHHSVLNCAKYLQKKGHEVYFLKVDSDGIIDLEDFKKNINENVKLVSVMFVNNEIGSIQPIEKISKICKKYGVLIHTDAIQAVGHMKIDVKELDLDILSISSHKFNGPKGTGVLYVRKDLNIRPLIDGGSQESGLRAGTENIANIVGLTKALEVSMKNMESENEKLLKFQDYIVKNILKIEKSKLNGNVEKKIPGILNFSFEGIEGEGIVLNLDACGIMSSTGSACTSSSLEPSHVLLALGMMGELAHSSLRLSFGKYNSWEEIKYIVENIKNVVNKLRNISPLWKNNF